MKINDNVIKVILEQAKKDAPIESCGLLLGKDDHPQIRNRPHKMTQRSKR